MIVIDRIDRVLVDAFQTAINNAVAANANFADDVNEMTHSEVFDIVGRCLEKATTPTPDHYFLAGDRGTPFGQATLTKIRGDAVRTGAKVIPVYNGEPFELSPADYATEAVLEAQKLDTALSIMTSEQRLNYFAKASELTTES
jgi:hypothetical protein